MSDLSAQTAAAQVARDSYGKLLARLACQWKDLAAAEDALAEAFEKALTQWPRRGVPRSPQAWILTVARRQLTQRWRRSALERAWTPYESSADNDWPDDRLRLLLVCAHPCLDSTLHTPMMLQMVLGLQAKEIASALLVSPESLAQKLVRAKRKLKDARVGWEEPDREALTQRVQAILDAIYAAYALSWDSFPAIPNRVQDLDGEALYLAHLIVSLQPGNPEALGLLSLLLHCEARKLSRQDEHGRFVPLAKQDTAKWDAPRIGQAEQLLRQAARWGRAGPYQLEAAIQSAHNQRLFGLPTPWQAIAALYQQLNGQWASWGSLVGESIACAESAQYERAQNVLDQIPKATARSYQPWWVAQAYLAEKLGDGPTARKHYLTASGLCSQPALRDYLKFRADDLKP